MRISVLLLIFGLFTNFGTAQESDSLAVSPKVDSSLLKMELELMELGKTVLNDSLLVKRLDANVRLSTLLEKTVVHPDAYEYQFDSLYTISKLRAPDNSFRIFTWQLFEDDDAYTYFGYIIHKDGRVISLADTSLDYFTPEFETGDQDHWYGALYYNLIPFVDADSMTQYLVFGFDGNSLMERRKVIDVLQFDEEGNPTFGAPIFLAGPESRSHPAALNRIILEYFAGASVKCNYDELQSQILYEHLIFKKTPYGEFLIPDGSYEGYLYQEGKWIHNAKVFHQVSESPPFPKQVLTKELKKDLFGNKYKRATMNPNRNSTTPGKKKKN